MRKRVGAALALILLLALAAAEPAAAHGLGGIRNLPVPGWLFLVGGGTVLVVSFLALGVLWKEPRLDDNGGRRFPPGLERALLSPWLQLPVRLLSFALFVVVWTAAAFGTERVSQNIAPTFVYVVFWVGMVVVSVLAGNVWSVVNPWRTAADAVAGAARRVGIERRPRDYPAGLGIWPAGLLLFAFTALELVYSDPANPRMLAIAIGIYSAVTWSGMLVYGRKTWGENGDGLAVYFGFLSRVALFGARERDGRRELVVRKPLSELGRIERRPGAVAFLAVMLGTVAFDGISRSSRWIRKIYDIETSFSDPTSAERAVMLFNLSGLILMVLFVATVYTVAVKAAEGVVGRRAAFSGVFVGSLIPIAIVYALSHYFSLLVIQGQFAIPLLSDPYGKGWNVLGTAGFEPNLGVLAPNATWYTQVSVLVLGHVAALIVAHDRAVAESPSPQVALRTQNVMLALMVLYTVGGMWLLSIG